MPGTNGERYVTWRWLTSVAVGNIAALAGITIFAIGYVSNAVDKHDDKPSHLGALSKAEYVRDVNDAKAHQKTVEEKLDQSIQHNKEGINDIKELLKDIQQEVRQIN